VTDIDVQGIIASLPSDLQAAIKALVAQELEKNLPPPPRVLTASEQAAQYLSQAHSAVFSENIGLASGELWLHDRVLTLLELIVDKVFPAEAAAAATSSGESI
jgi:hypothetical protein